MKLLKLEIFNVRFDKIEFKRHQLNLDLKRYEIDICGLQETTISEKVDKNVGSYRMILVKFQTLEDLDVARTLAEDRDQWKKLTKLVCNIA